MGKKDLSKFPGHEKDYEPDSYETQGMAVKLKEHDEELKKYKTFTYPCESHKVWCCGGSQDLDEEPEIAALYPYTLASEAQRRDPATTRFDKKTGACCNKGAFRVVILDREEEMSTELARKMMPTLCEECARRVPPAQSRDAPALRSPDDPRSPAQVLPARRLRAHLPRNFVDADRGPDGAGVREADGPAREEGGLEEEKVEGLLFVVTSVPIITGGRRR